MDWKSNGDAAFQRSKAYKLFSCLFSFPDGPFFEFMEKGEFLSEMKIALERMGNSAPSLLSTLASSTEESSRFGMNTLQEEYLRLFEDPGQGSLLHEALYADFPQEKMADIAGFYRAFGVDFSQRPDHIGAELEFMHLLTAKEAQASIGENRENVELCLDAQRKFLSSHLGRWIQPMAEGIRSRGGFFYECFAKSVMEWLNMESEYLGITLARVEVPVLKSVEKDEMACPGGRDERV